ncbi:MAG: dethiobiotin synthase [Fuerstiella sp.]|nr:dethiobiotin synthase [Fuerstiella sp.]
MKTLFVSGTDTDVGKTWVSCQILGELRRRGIRIGAWKPVCSGAVQHDGQLVWEDIRSLASAIGVNDTDHALTDLICSHRFQAPMAPNVAARLEGRALSGDDLVGGLDAWEGYADLMLIEGAGGLLSPLSDGMLVADLAQRLTSPTLIVSANRLGTIHQTLATVEAAQSRGIKVVAVVLNEVSSDLDPVLRQANKDELKRLMPGIPLCTAGHGGAISGLLQEVDFLQWFDADRNATDC